MAILLATNVSDRVIAQGRPSPKVNSTMKKLPISKLKNPHAVAVEVKVTC
jgi:hypothetical protein